MIQEISTTELHKLQIGKSAEVKVIESYAHQKFAGKTTTEPTEININAEVKNFLREESIAVGLELSVNTSRMDISIKGITEIHLKPDWAIKHSTLIEFVQFSIIPRMFSSLLSAMKVQASLIGQHIPFEPEYLNIQQKLEGHDLSDIITYVPDEDD